MTIAPEGPSLPFAGIDDAIEALRARGLRLSMSRQLVLEALFAAAGPVSAETLAVDLGLVATSVAVSNPSPKSIPIGYMCHGLAMVFVKRPKKRFISPRELSWCSSSSSS